MDNREFSVFELEGIIPNTTQVPNILFDYWVKELKDTELRILLLVIRQTLGWIEDKRTGRRKERDWISQKKIMAKTGRSTKSIADAIDELVNKNLIDVFDGEDNILKTKEERSGRKCYYRLNTSLLFSPTSLKSKPESSLESKHYKRNPIKETIQKEKNNLKDLTPKERKKVLEVLKKEKLRLKRKGII